MELSDDKVLESLLRDWEREQQARKAQYRGRNTTPDPSDFVLARGKSSRRRCGCGLCANCKENERWEKIFQTKFADPDYYRHRSVHHVSPLSD
jgi:hypothetical protein